MSGTPRKPLLACVLALMLAGCGGDDSEGAGTLTDEQAAVLQENLIQAEDHFSSGRCDEAEEEADQLVDSIDALPAAVGTDVKDPLREMAQNLEQLAAEQCRDDAASDEQQQPDPEPEPPAPPVPTTDPTTETETTETTETSEDEEEEEEQGEEEEEPPPDEEPKPPEPSPDPEPPSEIPPGQQPGAPGNSGDSGGTGGVGEEGGR